MNSLLAHLLRGLVIGYRYLVSPVLPASCRYSPSCSAYALEAFRKYGALSGAWLSLRRILRCHPWGGAGFDPVPDHRWNSEERGGCTENRHAAGG